MSQIPQGKYRHRYTTLPGGFSLGQILQSEIAIDFPNKELVTKTPDNQLIRFKDVSHYQAANTALQTQLEDLNMRLGKLIERLELEELATETFQTQLEAIGEATPYSVTLEQGNRIQPGQPMPGGGNNTESFPLFVVTHNKNTLVPTVDAVGESSGEPILIQFYVKSPNMFWVRATDMDENWRLKVSP